MDRREFLAHLGAGALAIVGLGGIIRMLTNYTPTPHHHQIDGYGSGAYGGSNIKKLVR